MTGWLRKWVTLTAAIVLFSSCQLMTGRNNINVTINSQKHGWYFIELNYDDSAIKSRNVDIRLNSPDELRRLFVEKEARLSFRIYDDFGTEISERMKLPSYLFHSSGKKFFKFYNPTDQELAEIAKWNPTDPTYTEIHNRSRKHLERILKKN